MVQDAFDQIPTQDQTPAREAEEIPEVSQPPKPNLKQKIKNFLSLKKVRLALLGLGLLGIAAIGISFLLKPTGPKPITVKTANAFTLAASSEDSLGVNPQSHFILKSKEPVAATTVKAALTINPKTDFEIQAQNGTEFIIAPKNALTANTVYRFGLAATETNGTGETKQRDYSWAFQIKNPFRVVQTLPRDEAIGVPANTGIEITFSHENFKDFEKYFEITPTVSGRFEKHKRTAVFAPQNPLAEKTLYTVKIKRGLPLEGSQETLPEDYIFQFEPTSVTSDIEKPYFHFNRELSQFPPAEPPALGVWLSYNNPAIALDVWVYKFNNETDFLNALKARDNIPSWSQYGQEKFRYPTAGLPEVAKFTVPVEGSGTGWGGEANRYIRFPEPITDGFYLVKASTTNQDSQTFLQVSNLSGYLATSQTKSVVWINDLSTKQSVSGAKVALVNTNFTQSTGNDGTAYFDTPSQILEEETPHYFRAESQGRVVILPVTPIGPNALPISNLYWKYLYTDRTLYLPTDTVKFWGLVQKRENHQSQTLTATLTKYDYFDYFGEPINIYEQEVAPSDWGAFNGAMELKNLQPGGYNLNIKIGDEVITSRWVDVETYHKPAYEIDIETEKKAIIAGDTAVYKIKTQFFEGTPVPNLRLQYSGVREGELTTDARGQYTITHQTVPVASPSAYTYQSGYLSVRPVLPEEGEIDAYADVRIFNSAYTIDAKAERTDSRGEVTGTIYQVDLQKLNGEDAQSWDDYKGAPVPNQKIDGKIYEQWWDKIETGEYYDFINKKVRQTYRYESRRKYLDDFSATTGENGQFKVGFEIEKDKDYQIELTAADPQGRVDWTQVYISGGENQAQTSSDVRINSNQSSYKIGDEVGLTFKRGDETLPSGGNNRYLYFLAQNGIREFKISSDSSWKFAFKKEFAPSTVYRGVYFNGDTYQENGGGYSRHFEPSIYLDKEERKLAVEVTPDKESYEPGDQVNLNIQVTDQNKKGVAAEVNVSLIDEALAEISWTGQTTPLDNLYSTVPSGVFQTFSSHQYPVGMPLEGGGGGGGAREEFKDNAFFGVVQTDGDGRSKVSFKLPDNLTSWRTTTQAISKSLSAGGNVSFLPVKLPFFVEATFNDTYLTADKPVIKFRAFGTQLTEGQDVTFTITSDTLGINSKVGGKAFTDTEFALPTLKEGEHKISIKGEAGKLTDEFIRTIRVVSSRLEKTTAEYYDLSSATKIEGSQTKPTTLIFTDRNRGQYYSTLLGLAYEYGDRVDQRLAQVEGRELLQEYFDEQLPEAKFTPSDYQAPSGGIALLPYSDADPELSAKVANVAGERFDTESLIQYLYAIVDSDEEGVERVSQALFGLAALDEPVLNLVNQLLENTKLTPQDGVFLALALDKLGDKEMARQVYAEIVSKYSEETKPYLRLKIGKDQDDFAHYTALVSILASDLETDEKEKLIGYTLHSAPKDLLLNLEKLAFTETELPKLEDQPAKFAYQIGSTRKEVSVQRGKTSKLQVSPLELAQIKFEVLQGNVGLTSQYNVPATTADLTTDPALQISRQYTVSGRNTTDFAATDLIRVDLGYGFGPRSLDGLYRINDFLPSGLRIINQPYSWNIQDENISYPYKIENQEVSFARTKPYTKPIYCYARVLNKGEYVAEPAFIQSATSLESINSTSPQTITIR